MEKADDIIDYKAVGKRIKTVRRNKGLSQKALAAVVDINATNLSHIERGATKLSLPTLVKIANQKKGRFGIYRMERIKKFLRRRQRYYPISRRENCFV